MLVHYFGTWMGQSLVREFDWRTDCERGALFQKQMFSDLYVARAGSDVLEPVPLEPDQAFTDDTRRLLKGFIRDLQAGEEPQPSGMDNLKTMAVTCACIESARASGERIEMAEYYRRYGLSQEDLTQTDADGKGGGLGARVCGACSVSGLGLPATTDFA